MSIRSFFKKLKTTDMQNEFQKPDAPRSVNLALVAIAVALIFLVCLVGCRKDPDLEKDIPYGDPRKQELFVDTTTA